jgi:hypothetical protein
MVLPQQTGETPGRSVRKERDRGEPKNNGKEVSRKFCITQFMITS